MTALSQHRSLLSTMQSMILFGLITATVTVNGGRINGDPLLVGDVVRIRVIIEEDNYFGVVACGSVECGGVRLDGLDKNGIGFSTFISHIEDVQTADKENKTLRLRWVLKQDTSSGTFETGRQHIFVVSRPTPRKMLFWIDGKNDSVIETFLKEGPATLRVVYANGPYNFIDKQSKPEQKTIPDSVCAAAQLDSYRAELNDSNADALEVLVGCRHKSDDKVDAMCIVYIAVEGDKTKVEIFRSKTSPDTYVATGSVKLPFRFQEQQILVMEVYQGMTSCEKPKSSQLIGTNQTHLSRVNALGKVEISASTPQEVFYTSFQLNCEDKVTLSLSGKNIPGDRDVFLKIMRAPSQGVSEKFQSKSFLEVAETDVVPRDIDFVHWGNLTLSVKELCDGDYDLPIKIYAFGVDDEGSKLIGAFETTLNGIKNQHGGFLLRAQSGAQGLAYNNTGVVFVGEIPIPPTFSQYVAVGFELVGSIQIDFTGSNEAVTPSLHDVTGNLTSYEVAIISVGEVVEKFVADSVFKVHGFGATIPGDATESFDFGINLDTGSPDCKGVTGVRKAYRNAVPRLNMGGPTHFAPGIKKLVDHAKRFSDGSKYFVHLLLSDGLLHDAKETEQAILEASSLPISIIIVGIGNIDFSELKTVIEHVSATKKFINTVGHTERDIVQFVAMKDFVASNSSETLRALRKRVLSKIPPQYLEYMRIKKIAPKPIKGFTKTRVC